MEATLSELHRETRRVIRPVIHAGKEVVLTEHGSPVARIVPLGAPPVGSVELRPDGFFADAFQDAERLELEEKIFKTTSFSPERP